MTPEQEALVRENPPFTPDEIATEWAFQPYDRITLHFHPSLAERCTSSRDWYIRHDHAGVYVEEAEHLHLDGSPDEAPWPTWQPINVTFYPWTSITLIDRDWSPPFSGKSC